MMYVIMMCLYYISDPGVRDAAAEAMGVAFKYLGEKNVAPFIADLDALKLAKVLIALPFHYILFYHL